MYGAANRRTGCVALSGPISVLALLTLHQHFRVCVCMWACFCVYVRVCMRERERALRAVIQRTCCHQGLDEIRHFERVCVRTSVCDANFSFS